MNNFKYKSEVKEWVADKTWDQLWEIMEEHNVPTINTRTECLVMIKNEIIDRATIMFGLRTLIAHELQKRYNLEPYPPEFYELPTED